MTDLSTISWWCPSITRYGGPQLSPMDTTTVTRWEAAEFISTALSRGLAVEVWDGCPTCLPQQRYAAGPSSPLTCPVRPASRRAPRYS